MVQWLDGTKTRWHNGTMQWHDGTWHDVTMDGGKFDGTTARGTWLDGTMAIWHKGSLVQCDDTMAS